MQIKRKTINRRVSQPINTYLSVLDKVIAEAAAAEEARKESDIPQQEVSSWCSSLISPRSTNRSPPPANGLPFVFLTSHPPIQPTPPSQIVKNVWLTKDNKTWSLENLDLDSPPPPPETSHPFDPSHMKDFEDASLINNLHEAPLLYLLLRRFSEQNIYTNCSDVLISVNPYRKIEGMYTDDKIKVRRGVQEGRQGRGGGSLARV